MNNKKCKKIAGLLAGYIDNELKEEEILFIGEHLKECVRCSKLLEDLEYTDSVGKAQFYSNLPEQHWDSQAYRIMSEVQNEKEEKYKEENGRLKIRSILSRSGIFLRIAAAAAIFYVLFNFVTSIDNTSNDIQQSLNRLQDLQPVKPLKNENLYSGINKTMSPETEVIETGEIENKKTITGETIKNNEFARNLIKEEIKKSDPDALKSNMGSKKQIITAEQQDIAVILSPESGFITNKRIIVPVIDKKIEMLNSGITEKDKKPDKQKKTYAGGGERKINKRPDQNINANNKIPDMKNRNITPGKKANVKHGDNIITPLETDIREYISAKQMADTALTIESKICVFKMLLTYAKIDSTSKLLAIIDIADLYNRLINTLFEPDSKTVKEAVVFYKEYQKELRLYLNHVYQERLTGFEELKITLKQ